MGKDLAMFDSSEINQMNCYMDVVFCIDLTSSMQPALDFIKSRAEDLLNLFQIKAEAHARLIKKLRVRVIGFRDIYHDGEKSFEVSDFFNLPDENEEFKSFLSNLQAEGGGDGARNSLEALAMAMQSDWCGSVAKGEKKSHIIVLFTDSDAYPLEKSKNGIICKYPDGLPDTFDKLTAYWYGEADFGKKTELDQFGKRLILYAPDSYEAWMKISEDFDNVVCWGKFEPGNGCEEIQNLRFIM